MKQKYIGACLLIVGAILILHSNWSLLAPLYDVFPPGTIAFSIPAPNSSYTEINRIEIIIADPQLYDPLFLETIIYNDTSGISIELFRDPVITTKWVGLLESPIQIEGEYTFVFCFWSWEGLPYPYPGDWVWNEDTGRYEAEGGIYTIITQDGNGNGNGNGTDWFRILETGSGIAFLVSGILFIFRREKKWENTS